MSKQSPVKSRMLPVRVKALKSRWSSLCGELLPLVPDDSVWRYSRRRAVNDPDQGWKIHISATVLTASDVLAAVGTVLRQRGVLFKCPVSLDELIRINSGIWYGYCQVGKFITIYPRSEGEFKSVAREMHRRLPARFGSPTIPFDFQYADSSSVFYRYGSFTTQTVTGGDGAGLPAMLEYDGKLIPDIRNQPPQIPSWLKHPFPPHYQACQKTDTNPLGTRYHLFRALTQRGKGGVYQAFDTATIPPRLCIIKEGRKNGETSWDGRDGRSRVENEATVLSDLRKQGMNVPLIYDSFTLGGNFYLVMEQVIGTNLLNYVASRSRRFPLAQAIRIGQQIASLAAEIHAAGWVWRDCKPANLFVSADGSVRPIDFEGSCHIDRPDSLPWSTPGFAPPEVISLDRSIGIGSNYAEDLFALGVCLYFLFEGRLPPLTSCILPKDGERSLDLDDSTVNRRINQSAPPESFNVTFARRSLPGQIKSIISRLLSTDPTHRPTAEAVFSALGSIQRHLPQKRIKSVVVANRIE